MMKSVPASELRAARIHDNEGTDIGHLGDIAVSQDGGRVAHYVVVVRRNIAEELGLSQPSVTGEYRVHIDGDRVANVSAGRIDCKDDKWTIGRMRRESA